MIPILRRELLEVMRAPRTRGLQLGLAIACALLVLVRWPTGEVADLSGARSQEVLRVFGYGLLASILLLVPAFPATSLVRERIQGTLPLLLNSPMRPWSIYAGKLAGVLGFALLLLVMTLPAAAACHALGGTVVRGGVLALYGILGLAALQLSTLGLLVSSRSQSTDGALRVCYALALLVCVLTVIPYELMRGTSGFLFGLVAWVRCLSPIPAVMEVLGQRDVWAQGLPAHAGAAVRYALLGGAFSLACALATVRQLLPRSLDRPQPAGVMTEDLPAEGRLWRKIFFLVDPQRRSGSMTVWVNPVLVKEFRARRFGRSSWVIRLVLLSAVLSLALSYLALSGALVWGIEGIGGALVLLQSVLLILFAPSLAAGLVSAERESGSWQLLRMTPLSAGAILRGKLLSVAWPLVLLLAATLPGYVIMMTVEPKLAPRVGRVLACLGLTAAFALLWSAAVSSFFRSTAAATTAAYTGLLAVCVAPFLVWMAREAPFGHSAVTAVLSADPVAAALQASAMPGFERYELLPTNWWIIGSACVALLVVFAVRVRQLCRPE